MNYINKGKRDILLFPKFSNIDKIEKVRKKYDELYGLIKPHITLAFPFNSEISNEELKESLKEHLKDVKKFKINMQGISLKKDERKDINYIFLNFLNGKEEIIHIHNLIYEKVLNKKIKFEYVPHITLGCIKDWEKIDKEILDEILNEKFETLVDKIYLEKIGENEESIIEGYIDLED